MADKTYSVTAAMTPRQRFVHDYVERFILHWREECPKRGILFREDHDNSVLAMTVRCQAEALWDVSRIHVIGRDKGG